jgi:hypothetical protein
MRRTLSVVVAGFITAATPALAQSQPGSRIVVSEAVRTGPARAYQGRNSGPEQTERFSRKVKLDRDGRVSVANIAGDIVVMGGSGDEVSIEAVKRTRGDRSELAAVRITVDERPGRVEIVTEGEQNRSDRNRRSNHVSVDYTISMPAAAALELRSISGSVKVTGVRGAVRAETISGDVTAVDTPKLETAKTTSGNVSVTGVSLEGDLAAASVSGNVTARNVKAHGHGHRCGVRPAGRQVRQRQHRLLGRDQQDGPLRDHHALRQRAARAVEPARIRTERKYLQRVDPIRLSDDDWRNRGQ